MKVRFKRSGAALIALLASASVSLGTSSDESAQVAAAVESFHDALARGDAEGAMKLLAPDAAVFENGSAETRADYERDHLPEDIKFAQMVRSTRSDVKVEINGETAWLTSQNKSEGTVNGKPVHRIGVELAVLAKTPEGWRIRAIHWSSHKLK